MIVQNIALDKAVVSCAIIACNYFSICPLKIRLDHVIHVSVVYSLDACISPTGLVFKR